jgi:hypothetical protein
LKVSEIINTTKGFLYKHSPEILTGIGVTGMITSTVLAVKATPKALLLLEEAKYDKGEKLTRMEVVKTAWKPYLPAIITCAASATCIIGASTVNHKRNTALATAYAISEKTLLTYRDKVVETIGEKKEKEIREKIAQDEVDQNPVSNTQVFITPKGNTLCMDSISGRYFKSDIDTIKKVVNELNRIMTYENYISLDEFYHKLGLESIKSSHRLGWKLEDGLIELDFSSCLTDNDEPCVVVDYTAPKYGFDKLF